MGKTKIIISTVGTSILAGFDGYLKDKNSEQTKEIYKEARKRKIDKDDEENLFNLAKEYYYEERMGKLDENSYHNLSAEINALLKIGKEDAYVSEDKLYFLVSDTTEGEICGKLVKKFCEKYFEAKKTEVITIKGLQVYDAKKFETEAINNFVDEVININGKYDKSAYNVILNATGGYKAVIPYSTLLGTVFGLPVYYIFERSNQLIKLPNAPISFDTKLLEALGELIYDIENDYIELKDFLKRTGISYNEREKYVGAIVIEDDLVTLTPLGRLLYKRYLYTEGYSILVSDEVIKKLCSGQYDSKTFEKYFLKMRNPLYLRAKLHNEIRKNNKNIDLDCCKPGNVSERIFYYMDDENKTVKICDIFMHDEYENEIKKGSMQKENYSTFQKFQL
ncbi:putative CRISPR-associated protein [Peptococcaceae bacterium]|nr:putative CRISPR-associated protein [Peptococcaceae bacterium]